MKKLNVMIYAETLEALCELPNEDIGIFIKHIHNWNNGNEVIIENPLHKSLWKMILPDLERNKETYQNIVERNRENGKKGGRPKKEDENPVGYLGNPNEPKKPNYNYNYNYMELPKGNSNILQNPPSDEGDLTTPEGVEENIVSKGLGKLETLFPNNRNRIGIEEIMMWEKLLQVEKQELIKRATIYIREQQKKENGKYIKNLGKWLKEQIEGGITIKEKTATDNRLYTFTDGGIYTKIMDYIQNTNEADKLYHLLNNRNLFKDKEELQKFLYTTNKNELLQLLNQ